MSEIEAKEGELNRSVGGVVSAPPSTTEMWDQRFARYLVRPLVRTPIRPNHVTTLRLVVGLAACAGFAVGEGRWAHGAAALFVLSNFLDHADGELARMSGRVSALGRAYDLSTDAIIHILLFLAIGYGLRHSMLGEYALPMGLVAGVAVSLLFWKFDRLRRHFRQKSAGQPRWHGCELEDVMYLLGPITWLGGLVPLHIAATIGAPAFAVWLFWHYRRLEPAREVGSR